MRQARAKTKQEKIIMLIGTTGQYRVIKLLGNCTGILSSLVLMRAWPRYILQHTAIGIELLRLQMCLPHFSYKQQFFLIDDAAVLIIRLECGN